jgi:hypothetical protein
MSNLIIRIKIGLIGTILIGLVYAALSLFDGPPVSAAWIGLGVSGAAFAGLVLIQWWVDRIERK